MTVRLFVDNCAHPCKQWKFPGGEVGVEVSPMPERLGSVLVLICDIPTSDDIFAAMNLLDAIKRMGVNRNIVTLQFHYLPYARQDRKCKEGESFALQVFIKMLMSMQDCYGMISFDDVHSKVTLDEFDKLPNQGTVITNYEQNWFTDYLPEFDCIIGPDHGSAEKAAKTQPSKQHIYLDKVRIDGRVQYENYAEDVIVGRACIVDDICDGGATFIAAAEMLRKTQPRMQELSLFVTHGLFSKGVDKLKPAFDNVYTSNPMTTDALVNAKVIPF